MSALQASTTPRRDTVNEVFRQIYDILPPIATFSFYHHVPGSGENSQLSSLHQEGKRKMDNVDYFVAFQRVAWRFVSCLTCFRALMGMAIRFLVGAMRNIASIPTFYSYIEIVECQIPGRANLYRLQIKKKIGQTSLTEKIYELIQRSCIHRQG